MRRTHRATCTIAALLIALGISPASAAAWRCGNSYSDQPCAGGQAIEVEDPRSPADRRAQDAANRDTRRQADAMARERRALEAQASRQRPAVIALPTPEADKSRHETQAARPRTHRPKQHARGDTDAFTASDPATALAGGKKKKRN